MRYRDIFLSIVLTVLSIYPNAFAEVYTVIPTDNLTKACAGLKLGDELVLSSGEYTANDTNYCEIKTSGTSEAPITVRGEDPQNPPVIKRTSGTVFNLIGVSYVNLTDISCDGSPGNCVKIKDSSYINITGIHAFRNNQGVEVIGSHNVKISFSVFLWNSQAIYVYGGSSKVIAEHNIGLYNARTLKGDRCTFCAGGSLLNPAGNDITFSRNVLAYNGGPYNDVNPSDAALTASFGPRLFVNDNQVWMNRRTGINTAETTHAVVSNNYVVNNGTHCQKESNISGLMIANGAPNTMVFNNTVMNNCVAPGALGTGIGAGAGLLVRAPPSRDMKNISLFNNRVSGTKNGPDYLVDPKSSTQGLWTPDGHH